MENETHTMVLHVTVNVSMSMCACRTENRTVNTDNNNNGIDKVVPNIDFRSHYTSGMPIAEVYYTYMHRPHHNHHFHPDTKTNGPENVINGY